MSVFIGRKSDDDVSGADRQWSPRQKNSFLSRVCVLLRETRPLIPDALAYTIRTEVVGGASFARLWFRTSGCTHDRQGSCTFCNYGRGGATDIGDMVSSVARGLSELSATTPTTLLVSPSGSMFDEVEVPSAARRAILELIAASDAREVLCETRAETVTDANAREFAELMAGKSPHIEVGLESSDPWVSNYCVNKTLSLDDYREAIARINAHGIGAITNVVVGTPFLSPNEVIEDAVQSIRWALDQGSASCVLFPLHVRGWTLVEWLWRRHMYQPPSLWSLVEVLRVLGPERSARVTISWYRDYDSGSGADSDSTRALASPMTCPRCQDAVLALLDAYRESYSFDLVRELSFFDCPCHESWRRELEASNEAGLVGRVALAYEIIGRDVLGDAWWGHHGAEVLEDLTRNASRLGSCRPGVTLTIRRSDTGSA